MTIVFTKMHLLGNDFVVIDGTTQSFKPNAALIRQWANRHTGIGFDQLLLIEKPRHQLAHFQYRIFNANGNEVMQCGNGALCIAQFLANEKLCTNNPIRIMTKTGLLTLRLGENGKITADLGTPIFELEKIPFISGTQGPIYSLETPFGCFDCCVLSLGNPHCVLEVNHLETAPVDQLGSYLNQSPHAYFSQGTNVEFIKIHSPQQISMRVYERGVGETQACGSGACAAVVAGHLFKQIGKEVTVQLPGGVLDVTWQGNKSSVFLTGKGETVFQGRINLP